MHKSNVPPVDPDEAAIALFQALSDAEKTAPGSTDLASTALFSGVETRVTVGQNRSDAQTKYLDLFGDGNQSVHGPEVDTQPNPKTFEANSERNRRDRKAR